MTSNTSLPNGNLFRSSLSSASSLMALQLVSRLFTFVLNQALFRMVSPRAFGTAAIQFELMLSTILFLSREGVRNALLRAWPGDEGEKEGGGRRSAATANLAFLPLLIGFPLAIGTSCFYASFAGNETKSQAYFHLAILVYAMAALMELLSEPMHNMAMAELRTGVRVRAEGLGITSKTVVTFLVLLYDSTWGSKQDGELALLAFAGGQLAYGIFVLATYVSYYGRVHLWPKASTPPPSQTNRVNVKAMSFDPEMLKLSMTMTSQSIIKHFLTEGDKLILSWFSPLQDQGGYAIAVNYGSLVARIVLQPIEEISRAFFSKILAVSTVTSASSDTQSRQALHQAAGALVSLLSVQASLSVILLVFGTAYMPIVLHLLLPRQYLSTSAPQVLAVWIWYIPVLAVNGGLEAFLSSVATPQDLNKQSRWMAGFSVIYISAAMVLYGFQFGDASLVYANIINLSIRIAYSLFFITSFFRGQQGGDMLRWKDVVPKPGTVAVSLVSMGFIWYSERRLGVMRIVESRGRSGLASMPVVLHVGLGGTLALICLSTWWVSSGRFLAITRRTKSE